MNQALDMTGYKGELIVVPDPADGRRERDSGESPDIRFNPEEAERLREFFEILNGIAEREGIC